MDADVDHAALIRPFLSRNARARFTAIDPGTKKRTQLLDRLCHKYESTLDWRMAQPIPAAEQKAELIAPLLRQLGAGNTCYALCYGKCDGLQMPLADALGQLVCWGDPVLLICVQDSLAYFQPEEGIGAGRRYVLHKRARSH